jgi:hypothetical protein
MAGFVLPQTARRPKASDDAAVQHAMMRDAKKRKNRTKKIYRET